MQFLGKGATCLAVFRLYQEDGNDGAHAGTLKKEDPTVILSRFPSRLTLLTIHSKAVSLHVHGSHHVHLSESFTQALHFVTKSAKPA